jgi:hypothetical protein
MSRTVFRGWRAAWGCYWRPYPYLRTTTLRGNSIQLERGLERRGD